MSNARQPVIPCACAGGKGGRLVLVTIGAALQGDDGIASAVCSALNRDSAQLICRCDLSSHDGNLADCLALHAAAIIIDSTKNGTAVGTVSVLDLQHIMEGAYPIYIRSRHGFSLADQLRVAKKSGKLPKHLLFFGVEVSGSERRNRLSPELKQAFGGLIAQLTSLTSKVLEVIGQEDKLEIDPPEQ